MTTGRIGAEGFAAGQVWTYDHRPGEEGSTLLVNRVDDDPDFGAIVHIGLRGLRVRSPNSPDGFATEMAHCPIALEALQASVRERIGDAPVDPEYLEGYAQWRGAADEGHAGVWSLGVAEIVDSIEQAVGG